MEKIKIKQSFKNSREYLSNPLSNEALKKNLLSLKVKRHNDKVNLKDLGNEYAEVIFNK